MGTPDFSVAPLDSLINAGHEIVYVVTMPDRVRGRGNKVSFSPVKEYAVNNNLKVLQPNKMKDEEFIKLIKEACADVFVVVAYGKIIPPEILSIPELGCINIHASLLPDYRGAAPIQWAIIDGLEKTGITTMLMDEGLDTGDILKQYELDIEDDETSGTLFEKLSKLGAEAIVDTLSLLEKGEIVPKKQGETETKYARMLTKDDEKIDFSKDAVEIERIIRGLNPSPKLSYRFNDKNIKLLMAEVFEHDSFVENNLSKDISDKINSANTGEFFKLGKKLFLKCMDKPLLIKELQVEGKNRMSGEEFLRGYGRSL